MLVMSSIRDAWLPREIPNGLPKYDGGFCYRAGVGRLRRPHRLQPRLARGCRALGPHSNVIGLTRVEYRTPDPVHHNFRPRVALFYRSHSLVDEGEHVRGLEHP